jgi:site-specific recombinase XerD
MGMTALVDLVDDYLAHCLSEGRKRNTVENAYGYPLRHVFIPWCERQGVIGPSELTKSTVERYQGELLSKGGARGPLSPATVHSYVRVVNQLLAWARDPDSGVEAAVPNGKVKLPRLPKTLKNILSRSEIERLEDKARSERDKLIIRVFGDTGMRVGELVKLRVEDLVTRQRKNFLHVRGKGDLDRLAPIIDPSLWRRLKRYAERGRPADCSSDALFLAHKRRAGQDELMPLTYSGVEQMLRQVTHDAGIKKRVHPHLFRYSAATWMRTKHVDPMTICRVMGWTSMRMLQRIYDQAAPEDDYATMAELLRREDEV